MPMIGSKILGGSGISSTILAWLTGVTPGTVTASKVVVVDSNKDISSFNQLTAYGLNASGYVNILSPDGASSVNIQRSDESSNSTVTLAFQSVSDGRTIRVKDPAPGLVSAYSATLGYRESDAYNTAAVTNNNQTGEQTMLTLTIPANTSAVGWLARLNAVLDLVSVNGADTCTVRAKVGSTTIASTVLSVADVGPVLFDGTLLIQVSGASGKLATFMTVEDVSVTPTQDLGTIRNVDFTASNTISLTSQWDAADAANQLTLTMGSIKFL